MNRYILVLAAFGIVGIALAQQQPPPPPPGVTRIEARKEVVVNWTLGDQAWNFRDILSTYEPVTGFMEAGVDPAGNPGHLAVWRLQTVKDLEEGTVRLYEQM